MKESSYNRTSAGYVELHTLLAASAKEKGYINEGEGSRKVTIIFPYPLGQDIY